MKRIAWINSDSFRDTDIPIIRLLCNEYEVDYYLVLNCHGTANIDFLKELTKDFPNFKFIPINGMYRLRSLKYANLIFDVLSKIHKAKYDKVFTGIKEDLYMSLLYPLFINKKRSIYMLHDAERHPNAHFSLAETIATITNRIIQGASSVKMLFSKEQNDIFKRLYPTQKSFFINKPCAFFGTPTIKKEPISKCCNFLFFGSIGAYKNIEVLIEAIENLHAKGIRNFKVNIIGKSYYEEWKSHIKTSSLFNLDIRGFEDSEIPNLFENNHFLVLPYKQATQSGPFSLALKYNIPVIASDIDVFKNQIIDGETGYVFEKGNVLSLEDVLLNCINMTDDNYYVMQNNVLGHYNKLFDESLIFKEILNVID